MENEITLTEDEKMIVRFLKLNEKDYFNVSDLSRELNFSYTQTLRRVEILERIGVLKIIKVGNNKIVSISEGGKELCPE